jgi:hypothetical protein
MKKILKAEFSWQSVILISIATVIFFFHINAGAIDIGLVGVSDTLSFGPLLCRDTLSKEAVPDSVHVLVWYGGCGNNTCTYTARSVTPKSENYIDTTTLGGHQYFYYKTVVDTIDGNKAGGPYTGGVVFFKQGQPTINQFSFTKIGNTAKNYFARIDTTISSRLSITGVPAYFDIMRLNEDGYVSVNFNDYYGAVNPGLFTASYYSKIADTVARRNIGIDWGNIANASTNVNLSNTRLRIVDSLVALTNNSITSSKLASEAIDAAKIKDGAFTNMKFANDVFDSLNFDNTYRAMLDRHAGGTSVWSTNQRDSLLELARSYKADSLAVNIGKHGVSTPRVSLHMKLGNYSGAAGDNNNLKDDIAALSLSGGGSEPETIIVKSLNDSSAIQGAKITIRTLDQLTTRVPGLQTDNLGRRQIELDPGSYVMAVTANNYCQLIDTISVLTGGGSAVVYLAAFDPGQPPSPHLCRVYGWISDLSGEKVDGVEISAEIPKKYQPAKYAGMLVTPYTTGCFSDSLGYWALDLIPNELLSERDSKYLFTIKYHSGVIYRVEIAVPRLTSWQLQ